MTLVISAVVGSLASLGTSYLQAWRERRDKRRDRLQDILDTYREPLASAAFDLQSRLYNICVKGFMDEYLSSEREYAVRSTQWLVSQYLGWNEIIRQRIQFLKVDDAQQDLELVRLRQEIASAFASDGSDLSRPLRTWRSDQRAIGELMIVDQQADRWTCIGYGTFLRRVADEPLFSDKVDALQVADLRDPSRQDRAVRLQRALVDLIERMDVDRSRFPLDLRGKIPLDEPLSPADALEELRASTKRPRLASFRFDGSFHEPAAQWAAELGWHVVHHTDSSTHYVRLPTWRRPGGRVTVERRAGRVEIRAVAALPPLWQLTRRRLRVHEEPVAGCTLCDVNVLLAMFDRPIVRDLPSDDGFSSGP
ncbi:MAG TPA: hypothetical protein VEW93_04860 [Acidimicrobiales bacterium]|nr:hypothetical protein [Acidimicrobiales bacterium]